MKRRRAKRRRAATIVASDKERKRSGRPKAIDSQDVKRAQLHASDLVFKPALDKGKTVEQPISQHGVGEDSIAADRYFSSPHLVTKSASTSPRLVCYGMQLVSM